METSYFTNLNVKLETSGLKEPLGTLFSTWIEIRDFVFEKYPKAVEVWFVSVKKYGWSFRIKDKKRAIIYLSPQKGHFRLTMVFGQKATDRILGSGISESVKTELLNSKVYMEGYFVLKYETIPVLKTSKN